MANCKECKNNKKQGSLAVCGYFGTVISNSRRGGSDDPCDEFSRVEETIIEEATSKAEPINKYVEPIKPKVDINVKLVKDDTLPICKDKIEPLDINVKSLDILIEVNEIAKLFKVSRQTVYNWLKSNKLKSNMLVDVIDAYNSMGGGIAERQVA